MLKPPSPPQHTQGAKLTTSLSPVPHKAQNLPPPYHVSHIRCPSPWRRPRALTPSGQSTSAWWWRGTRGGRYGRSASIASQSVSQSVGRLVNLPGGGSGREGWTAHAPPPTQIPIVQGFVGHTTGRQISSRLLSMRAANGLLCLPAGSGTRSSTQDAFIHPPTTGMPIYLPIPRNSLVQTR